MESLPNFSRQFIKHANKRREHNLKNKSAVLIFGKLSREKLKVTTYILSAESLILQDKLPDNA